MRKVDGVFVVFVVLIFIVLFAKSCDAADAQTYIDKFSDYDFTYLEDGQDIIFTFHHYTAYADVRVKGCALPLMDEWTKVEEVQDEDIKYARYSKEIKSYYTIYGTRVGDLILGRDRDRDCIRDYIFSAEEIVDPPVPEVKPTNKTESADLNGTPAPDVKKGCAANGPDLGIMAFTFLFLINQRRVI